MNDVVRAVEGSFRELLREKRYRSISGMSGKLLRQFELPYLAAEQAEELMGFATPLFAMIENNLRESKTLAQARDALLPKLMSGEIDVSNVEPPV